MTRVVLLLLALVSLAAQAGPAFNPIAPGHTITVNQNGYAVQYPVQSLFGTSGAAVTQGRTDNSNAVATDAFVNQQATSATATIPVTNATGGVYNQATLGSGAQAVVFSSGGVVSSVLTIAAGGSGYAVGDLVVLAAGNSDAVLRVTSVSSGAVTAFSVVYGGSGYTNGIQAAAMAGAPGRRAVIFSGTLTSNLSLIITGGSYIGYSREVEIANNTTGAFTVTVFLSNGAGGTTGNGVVVPQGTNNSAAMRLYTDGVNDIWPETNAFPAGVTCSGSPTASFATKLGVVTHC